MDEVGTATVDETQPNDNSEDETESGQHLSIDDNSDAEQYSRAVADLPLPFIIKKTVSEQPDKVLINQQMQEFLKSARNITPQKSISPRGTSPR